jgi:hypothetical protein
MTASMAEIGRLPPAISISRSAMASAQTAKACAAYPPLAVRSMEGGKAWREKFRALPIEEKLPNIRRMIFGPVKYLGKAPRPATADPVAGSSKSGGADRKKSARPAARADE